jgi:hypothetical protein
LIDAFDSAAAVDAIVVAPDGLSALLTSDCGRRIEEWRPTSRTALATAIGSRDRAGAGYVLIENELVLLFSRDWSLRGIDRKGVQRFSTNLRVRHAFLPLHYVSLPRGRLALIGEFFSDPQPAVVTIEIATLVTDPDVVQRAIEQKPPVWDRATVLAAGPCGIHAAVLRIPNEDEVIDPGDEADDYPELWGFRGIYVRDLSTGKILERHPYTGIASSGAPIVGSAEWIAVQVWGGIDFVDRSTGTVIRFRETAAIDSSTAVAAVSDGNEGFRFEPLEHIWRDLPRAGSR